MRHLKRFNEDMDNHEQLFKDELKDFCETNLAYLLDEELEVRVLFGAVGYRLLIELNQNPQLWSDIKDHMIPFLTRLSNQYELRSFPINNRKNVTIEVTRDLEAARQNWPHRKTSVFYEVPRLINDDTKSGLTYDRGTDDILESYITEFEFLIDGYKKEPKKDILTKIKSFFK
jgi:hypothetical protein